MIEVIRNPWYCMRRLEIHCNAQDSINPSRLQDQFNKLRLSLTEGFDNYTVKHDEFISRLGHAGVIIGDKQARSMFVSGLHEAHVTDCDEETSRILEDLKTTLLLPHVTLSIDQIRSYAKTRLDDLNDKLIEDGFLAENNSEQYPFKFTVAGEKKFVKSSSAVSASSMISFHDLAKLMMASNLANFQTTVDRPSWKSETCSHCTRKGHDWSHCYYNPGSESYKGDEWASQKTQRDASYQSRREKMRSASQAFGNNPKEPKKLATASKVHPNPPGKFVLNS